MCSIISWLGTLPMGLLSRLLIESGSRGKDSTGLAFHGMFKEDASGHWTSVNSGVGEPGLGCFKMAMEPLNFIQCTDVKPHLKHARMSRAGIGHTRRASPGMPIDDDNAHPFQYWDFYFAHNGKIDNWRDLKTTLVEHFNIIAEKKKAAADTVGATRATECAKYSEGITTDSQVLGPFINAKAFNLVEGCMAIVWIRGQEVRLFRYGKEAVAAKIVWKWLKRAPDKSTAAEIADHEQVKLLTLVSSTREIVMRALEKTDDIEYDVDFLEVQEKHIYRLDITGLVDEGEVLVYTQPHVDEFSSQAVV